MAKSTGSWFSDSKVAQYQKFLSAVTAFVGVLVAQGILHGTAQAVVTAACAGVGAVLVALVPNALPKATRKRLRPAPQVTTHFGDANYAPNVPLGHGPGNDGEDLTAKLDAAVAKHAKHARSRRVQ